jgi:glycosyltransferase involved in cell wall biosynthesis
MNTDNNTQAPSISVIVTCYNDGDFLKECIESLANSSFKGFEIIIVDDCSTDPDTISHLNVLEKSGIKVLKKKANTGVGDSRNMGIKASSTNYILTLDADDLIHPTYLEKAIQQLESGFSVVYCNVQHFGIINSTRIAPEFSLPLLLTGNFIASCSAFTKEIWTKTGGFDVNMECYEDWEYWINVAVNGGTFYHLNEVLFLYRRKSVSRNTKCENPAMRAQIVEYVSSKHHEIYGKYLTEIISNLHRTISSMQQDILRLEEVAKIENKMELIEKLKIAEDQLSGKIEYYENSFFWKLKKITDKFRGR